VEESRGLYYNTSFLVGPEGYIGKQRKTHLSQDEYFYFKAGLHLPVFDLPFARIGIVVCFDNAFPEIPCSLAVKGAEILLSVHADRFGKWPESAEGRRKKVEDTKKKWTIRYQCRAKDTGCYEVICNAAGQAATPLDNVESNHAGGCMVVDPNGNIVAESGCKDIEEEMIVVPLYGRLIADRRQEKNFYLKHRRPEVFSVLSKPVE
jgi:predicted amidohydrolase